jgi:hypothetical protein
MKRRTMAAVMAVGLGLTTVAAPPAGPRPKVQEQGDRCGHSGRQRARIRAKARRIGASKRQVRKIMRTCRGRAGIPIFSKAKPRPTGPQAVIHRAQEGRGLDCARQSVYKVVWRTFGSPWLRANGAPDGARPRIASADFDVHFCWNDPRRARKRKVVFQAWDVEGDVTTYAGPLYSWEGGSGAGFYAERSCMHDRASKDCFRTWRTGRLKVCPLRIGCIGEVDPKADVMLYTMIGAGFVQLLETRPE